MRAELEMPAGLLVRPGDDGWDEARTPWNLAMNQLPEAVATPANAEGVALAVRWARSQGLRVTAQGTGHGATGMGSLDGTLLVRTGRLTGVEIDPERRRARAGSGALWAEVVAAAAEHGLATLSGSSPDVGIAGYTLGGGMSWLGRKYGLASNSVTAVEVVTAEGELVRADAETRPDLFWALRGGGGNFGVVTSLEVALHQLSEVVAGVLWWPVERGPEVLRAFRDLTLTALPDELTTCGRYLHLPPLPQIPEPVRGKSFAIVEAIHIGDAAEADRLLAPLRELAPVMDTVETIPVPRLSELHMDPPEPVPFNGGGLLLDALPDEALGEVARLAGAESGTPLLSVELRHLGGAIGRAPEGAGALRSFEAEYAFYVVGMAMPHTAAAVANATDEITAALAPWRSSQTYMNFTESRIDPSAFWDAASYERLLAVKAEVDPDNVFRANHPLVM